MCPLGQALLVETGESGTENRALKQSWTLSPTGLSGGGPVNDGAPTKPARDTSCRLLLLLLLPQPQPPHGLGMNSGEDGFFFQSQAAPARDLAAGEPIQGPTLPGDMATNRPCGSRACPMGGEKPAMLLPTPKLLQLPQLGENGGALQAPPPGEY